MKHDTVSWLTPSVVGLILTVAPSALAESVAEPKAARPPVLETPVHPPAQPPTQEMRMVRPAQVWTRGAFTSVQVNVDGDGNNIVGDAANEP